MKEQRYIVRTENAGVYYGTIKSREGQEATMCDVRNIWYWSGANSLMQLATDGVARPKECKFTCTVPELTLLGVIQIIPCSEKACKSIDGVAPWTL